MINLFSFINKLFRWWHCLDARFDCTSVAHDTRFVSSTSSHDVLCRSCEIGVGFFYSGLLRRKNALSMIFLSMMTVAVVSFEVRWSTFPCLHHLPPPLQVVLLGLLPDIQWYRRQIHWWSEYVIPIPIYTSISNIIFIEYFGLRGVLDQPSIGSPRVPSIVFCVYQLMFAAITYVLLS